MKSFRDLIVWQKSHKFVLSVYKVTGNFPNFEIYCLVSQMRRSAISIPSNIAEGFKRRGKDSLKFYYYSEASLEELKYQLILSFDLGYIKEVDYLKLYEDAEEVGRLLNGWIKSQKLT